MKNQTFISNNRLSIGLGLLFIMGLLHRVLQLWLLWPQLIIAIEISKNNQMMQLLLKVIMTTHPWWGLWYLQQAPPLPNFIWACVLSITQSPVVMAVTFISFQALLSCVTAVAMALLLVRVGAWWWLGLVLASIFFLGNDLLVLEYNSMGQFYYEMMTMLFAVLACHAALSLVRSDSWKAAIGLGLCVAGLALTRASFSYFWPVVLAWLVGTGFWRKKKLIVLFLVPIFLFHGGWAFKNYYVHGYWSWSTSSWGGANLQQGERNRNGFGFNGWLKQQSPICASPWYEMTAADPNYFFLMPPQWDVILPPGEMLPFDVVEQDRNIAERRGSSAILDSVAARIWSRCLAIEFLHYWLAHPEILIDGAWRSYKLFWMPIRQFHVTQAFPLRAEMDVYPEGLYWWRALSDAWKEWVRGYLIQQKPLIWGQTLKPSDFVSARVIVLPFFPNCISAINFAILHSTPILVLLGLLLRQRLEWPRGFGFLLLTYCYLAGLSSVVEYGENMRFRIEVEPIIWVICFVVAIRWVHFFRCVSRDLFKNNKKRVLRHECVNRVRNNN